METAKLFVTGRSQAVRLPRAYRFEGTEVVIKHFGGGVLLLPKDNPWGILEEGLNEFGPGFEMARGAQDQAAREAIKP
jgi:antitoxin VapB